MDNFWLCPNCEKEDVLMALKKLGSFMLGQRDTKEIKKLHQQLAGYLGVNEKHLFLFNSGRSAFLTLLRSLSFPTSTEICLQGYTCNAAVNPILWAGYKPVYVDIDSSWNVDPVALRKMVEKNPDVRAIVAQHTFGIPAQLDKIKEICDRHKIILIEDCAHSLGAVYKGLKIGKFGDFAYFSFGRDKVISGVSGGALLVNNHRFLAAVKKEYAKISFSSGSWTFRQLIYFPLFKGLILPLYDFLSIGKILLYLFQKVHLLFKAIESVEKKGQQPSFYPRRMSGQMTALVNLQLAKIDRLNSHRLNLAIKYRKGLKKSGVVFQKIPDNCTPVFLRFGITTQNAMDIRMKFRRQGAFLDRWLGQVIGPLDTDLAAMKYRKGTCPKAEKLAERELQFPTGIRIKMTDAEKLLTLFQGKK